MLFGTTIAILFSLGLIYLCYLLGKRLFSEDAGLLASFFLACSQSFLLFSHRPLSEIPSAFFLLLGILLLIKSRFFLAGTVFGLSILMRFYQGISIAFIILSFFLFSKERREWKIAIPKLAAGILAILSPYFLLAWQYFGDPLYPLMLQSFLSAQSGMIYVQPWWFYIFNLLKENFLLIVLLALPFFWREKNINFLSFPALSLLLIYSMLSHKEMRLLLPFLPLLLIVLAYCVLRLLGRIKNRTLSIGAAFLLFSGVLGVSLLHIAPSWSDKHEESVQEKFFQQKLKSAQGSVFITNPKYALASDARIAGLLYYPLVQGAPDIAFVNPCDLEGNSKEYESLTKQNLKDAVSSLSKTYSAMENGCEYSIYEMITS